MDIDVLTCSPECPDSPWVHSLSLSLFARKTRGKETTREKNRDDNPLAQTSKSVYLLRLSRVLLFLLHFSLLFLATRCENEPRIERFTPDNGADTFPAASAGNVRPKEASACRATSQFITIPSSLFRVAGNFDRILG